MMYVRVGGRGSCRLPAITNHHLRVITKARCGVPRVRRDTKWPNEAVTAYQGPSAERPFLKVCSLSFGPLPSFITLLQGHTPSVRSTESSGCCKYFAPASFNSHNTLRCLSSTPCSRCSLESDSPFQSFPSGGISSRGIRTWEHACT